MSRSERFWIWLTIVVLAALTFPSWGFRVLALCGFLSARLLREGRSIGGKAMSQRRWAA